MVMLDIYFRYLNNLNSEKSLTFHHEYCKSYEAIKIELPEEGSKISLTNLNRTMRVPFIVYADIESFTPKLSTCQPNPEKSYTKQYQKHITSRFCYHIKCFDDTLYSQQPVTLVKEFNDDDVAQIFIDTLEKDIKEIYRNFKFPKNMINTVHDKMIMIIPLFVISVTKNSVKIVCVIIVICLVSLEVMLMISVT